MEIDLSAILCAAGNFLGSMFGIVAAVPIEELVDDGTEKSIWTDCEGY